VHSQKSPQHSSWRANCPETSGKEVVAPEHLHPVDSCPEGAVAVSDEMDGLPAQSSKRAELLGCLVIALIAAAILLGVPKLRFW
jgi:hypothetical protein